MVRHSIPKQSRTVKRTGPKPKWKTMPDGLLFVTNLARLGLSNVELADAFGVVEQTIYNWIEDYPQFREALNKGKLEADAKITEALFKRATGYSHPEVKILTQKVKEFDENGNILREYTKPLLVDTIKHYPPDTGAAIFWLHNKTRNREMAWSNKNYMEIHGKDGAELKLQPQLNVKHLSLDELKAVQTLFPEITTEN